MEPGVDWLFDHPVPPEAPAKAPAKAKEAVYTDGPEKYKLIGFISHIGPNPHAGHYVAHLCKVPCPLSLLQTDIVVT